MNEISKVVYEALRLIQVPVTKATVLKTLNNHPHYPSLLSIRDTLLTFKVPNQSYKLEAEHIPELPTPCIVHLKTREGFSLIKNIDNQHVVRLNNNNEWITEPIDKFVENWTGVVMFMEPQKTSGEAEYFKSRFKELVDKIRLPLLGLFVCLLFFGIYFKNGLIHHPTSWWVLLVIKNIGLLFSWILMSEFFNGYKYIKKICGLNSQVDCEGVLKSEQSKLLGIISWTELVFIYYTGSFLWMALSGHSESILNIMLWLNILSIPFTLYSIYFQFIKEKKICLLCTMIILLSWGEFYLLLNLYSDKALNADSIFSGVISFLLPTVTWVGVKPWIEELQAVKQQLKPALKLKTDPAFFSAILQVQEKMPIENIEFLEIGNPSASNIVTIVTNPQCQPCQQLHQDMVKLIEETIDVKCHLVFSVGTDKNTEKYQLARYFLATSENHELKESLLHSWYDSSVSSFPEWKEKNNGLIEQIEDKQSEEPLQRHREWCRLANITGTPTVFVNGMKMPDLYDLLDLKYIFSSLS